MYNRHHALVCTNNMKERCVKVLISLGRSLSLLRKNISWLQTNLDSTYTTTFRLCIQFFHVRIFIHTTKSSIQKYSASSFRLTFNNNNNCCTRRSCRTPFFISSISFYVTLLFKTICFASHATRAYHPNISISEN